MTRYINADLRSEIEDEVRTFVTTKIQKSTAWKEMKNLEKQFTKNLRQAVTKSCPDEDLEVLRRYGLTSKHDHLTYVLSEKGIQSATFYDRHLTQMRVEFDPPIYTEKVSHLTARLLEYTPIGAARTEQAITLYKIYDALKCEIDHTVLAYVKRVSGFRTVKSLLKTHPDMKKFIPKSVTPAEPVISDTEKLIKSFEES